VLALSTAAAISLITLGVRGAWVPGSPVQPQLFVAIAMLGGVATSAGRVSCRLAPSRLARLSWKKVPELHGRHRDDSGPEGVTVTSPDRTQTFIPWSVIVSIRETGRTFVLRDRNGEIRVARPKRGLHDPALLPALERTFAKRWHASADCQHRRKPNLAKRKRKSEISSNQSVHASRGTPFIG